MTLWGGGEHVTWSLARVSLLGLSVIFLYFIDCVVYSNAIGDPCSLCYLGDWTLILIMLPGLAIFGEIILSS